MKITCLLKDLSNITCQNFWGVVGAIVILVGILMLLYHFHVPEISKETFHVPEILKETFHVPEILGETFHVPEILKETFLYLNKDKRRTYFK